MTKRSTDDPILRLFLDRYHLHLLAVPREGIGVGDVYVTNGASVSAPGHLTTILAPAMQLPEPVRNERLADLVGEATRKVELGAAARIIDNVLTGLGLTATIGARATRATSGTVRFRFQEVYRDSLDVLKLGRQLPGHVLDERNAALSHSDRLFVVTAALFTSAISLEVEHGATVDLASQLDMAVVGAADVSVAVDRSSRVTLSTNRRVGFAVELHELSFKGDEQQPRLTSSSIPIAVRGATRVRERVVPAVLGGPDSDIFLDVG